MKSFSKIVRAKNGTKDLQLWSPMELIQAEILPADSIHARNANFFEVTTGFMNDDNHTNSRSLLKGEGCRSEVQQWFAEDFKNETPSLQINPGALWVPFIEKDNPQKKAARLIDDARVQANEIVLTAQQIADQIRQDAQEQGIESSKAEMRETLQAAYAIITVAREWRADMMCQSEHMVIDLVKKIGQKMFGDGLVLDNAILQQHFAEVLESARALDDLRIYMNPLDAAELGPDWREYQASALGRKVEISSSESIKRGGCYIQGEWGTADALVETQLAAILHQFSEVEQPETGED